MFKFNNRRDYFMIEKQFKYGQTDLFEWVEENGKMISTKECVKKLNEQEAIIHKLEDLCWKSDFENSNLREELWLICHRLRLFEEENDNCKNDYRELFSNYVELEEENEQLRNLVDWADSYLRRKWKLHNWGKYE